MKIARVAYAPWCVPRSGSGRAQGFPRLRRGEAAASATLSHHTPHSRTCSRLSSPGRSSGRDRDTLDLAFISGCVTRHNGSRHGRYSAAGVSIGTERASITTTTNAGPRTGHLGRACAMHARPSRRCEIPAISRTRSTSRSTDADRRSLARSVLHRCRANTYHYPVEIG